MQTLKGIGSVSVFVAKITALPLFREKACLSSMIASIIVTD